jgi:hypothetical protein
MIRGNILRSSLMSIAFLAWPASAAERASVVLDGDFEMNIPAYEQRQQLSRVAPTHKAGQDPPYGGKGRKAHSVCRVHKQSVMHLLRVSDIGHV